jgi:hypothetical protein
MSTLADFRTNVAAVLGLENTSGGDQPLIDKWLNQAVRDILLKTHTRVTSTSVTPGAADDYTLATTVLAILEMYFTTSGQKVPLEPASMSEIIRRRRGSPTAPSPARLYHLAGHDTLMFYPRPAAADSLTMYYVPRPTAMSSGTDDPSTNTWGGIPVEYHEAIEFYALWRGADYDDDASSQVGIAYQAQYEKKLVEIRKAMRRKGGTRLAPAVVGRRRTRMEPTVPSQDIGL